MPGATIAGGDVKRLTSRMRLFAPALPPIVHRRDLGRNQHRADTNCNPNFL